MEKKHFMCTHTWGSDAVRDQVAEQSKEMTDVDFFALFKTEKAEVLQHWMGKDDFFYEALEAAQFNNLIVTMPNEMPRYVSSEKLTGKVMADPFG